jgi:hypothetical protein
MIPDRTVELALVEFTPYARVSKTEEGPPLSKNTVYAGSLLGTCALAGLGFINPAVAVLISAGLTFAIRPDVEIPITKQELLAASLVKTQRELEEIGFSNTRSLLVDKKAYMISDYTREITPEMQPLFIKVQSITDHFFTKIPSGHLSTLYRGHQIGISFQIEA